MTPEKEGVHVQGMLGLDEARFLFIFCYENLYPPRPCFGRDFLRPSWRAQTYVKRLHALLAAHPTLGQATIRSILGYVGHGIYLGPILDYRGV